jgi:hypothetical protein
VRLKWGSMNQIPRKVDMYKSCFYDPNEESSQKISSFYSFSAYTKPLDPLLRNICCIEGLGTPRYRRLHDCLPFDVINVMLSFLIRTHELITGPRDITNGTNGTAMGPLLGNRNPYPPVVLPCTLTTSPRLKSWHWTRIPGNEETKTF